MLGDAFGDFAFEADFGEAGRLHLKQLVEVGYVLVNRYSGSHCSGYVI